MGLKDLQGNVGSLEEETDLFRKNIENKVLTMAKSVDIDLTDRELLESRIFFYKREIEKLQISLRVNPQNELLTEKLNILKNLKKAVEALLLIDLKKIDQKTKTVVQKIITSIDDIKTPSVATVEDVEKYILDVSRFPFGNIKGVQLYFKMLSDPTARVDYDISKWGGACHVSAWNMKKMLHEKFGDTIKVDIKNVIKREKGRPLGHHSLLIEVGGRFYEYDNHLFPNKLLPLIDGGGEVGRVQFNKKDGSKIITSQVSPSGDTYVVRDRLGKEYTYSFKENDEKTFSSGVGDTRRIFDGISERQDDPVILQGRGPSGEDRQTLLVNKEHFLDPDRNVSKEMLLLTKTGAIKSDSSDFKEKAQAFLDNFKEPLSLEELIEEYRNLQKTIEDYNKKKKDLKDLISM